MMRGLLAKSTTLLNVNFHRIENRILVDNAAIHNQMCEPEIDLYY